MGNLCLKSKEPIIRAENKSSCPCASTCQEDCICHCFQIIYTKRDQNISATNPQRELMNSPKNNNPIDK